MTLNALVLILLVLVILGVLPVWPHSRKWGYRPTGLIGLLLIIVLLVLFVR
jgi:hypothetical protein